MVALHSCKNSFIAEKPNDPAYPLELKTLGDHLRKARLDRRLFQTDVARLLNVTADTVTGWELNRHNPPARYAKQIIDFLGYQPFVFEGASIGRQLQIGRLIKGHSQRQTANALVCDRTTVQFIEREKRQPRRKVTAEIQKYILTIGEK